LRGEGVAARESAPLAAQALQAIALHLLPPIDRVVQPLRSVKRRRRPTWQIPVLSATAVFLIFAAILWLARPGNTGPLNRGLVSSGKKPDAQPSEPSKPNKAAQTRTDAQPIKSVSPDVSTSASEAKRPSPAQLSPLESNIPKPDEASASPISTPAHDVPATLPASGESTAGL
jgi:hypothetical protein